MLGGVPEIANLAEIKTQLPVGMTIEHFPRALELAADAVP